MSCGRGLHYLVIMSNDLVCYSGTMNKYDWKSLAVTTLISISIALSLDSAKGQLLFILFKKVFSAVKMLVAGN